MFNFEKLRNLSVERGKELSYICSRLGVEHTYFADTEKAEQEIPNDRVAVIADLLDTTEEYLNDEEAKVVKEHLRSFQSQHGEPWKIIASATGVGEANVTQWCLGRSTGYMDHLSALSDLFGIPEDMLLGKTNALKHADNLDKIGPKIWNAIEHDPQTLRLINAVLKLSPEQKNELEKTLLDILRQT